MSSWWVNQSYIRVGHCPGHTSREVGHSEACFQTNVRARTIAINARHALACFQIQARCVTKPLYLLHYTSCLASVYAQGRVLSDLCHVCDAPGRGGSLGRLGRGLATSAEPLAHHTDGIQSFPTG